VPAPVLVQAACVSPSTEHGLDTQALLATHVVPFDAKPDEQEHE
jgi:hypothetical protein